MKKFICSSYLLLVAEIAFAQNVLSPQYQKYIETYKDIAIHEMRNHGVPASITLAQGILESGAGSGRLAVEANNHFGIKCHDWTGDKIYHDDDKNQECFRKYKHASQSFADHSTFLTSRPRYSFLFDLEKTDYKGWANGLKKAGYATDPSYPAKLIKIIEEYELYKYDKEATGKSKNTYLIDEKKENIPPRQTTNGASSSSNKNNETIASSQSSQKQNDKKVYHSEKIIGQISPYTEHSVRITNGVKYVIAQENDSYESIAEEFALKTNEIYAINDAPRGSKLETGEKVYLRAKKKTASRSFHVVKPNESLRDIAQQYGIKLSVIYKLNGIKEGVQPLIGQRIKLKK